MEETTKNNPLRSLIMSYSEYMKKLFFLNDLLKQGDTGTAEDLAWKLNVSRRTVFRYLDELRMNGAVIGYSKTKKTYYLENNFNFDESFW